MEFLSREKRLGAGLLAIFEGIRNRRPEKPALLFIELQEMEDDQIFESKPSFLGTYALIHKIRDGLVRSCHSVLPLALAAELLAPLVDLVANFGSGQGFRDLVTKFGEKPSELRQFLSSGGQTPQNTLIFVGVELNLLSRRGGIDLNADEGKQANGDEGFHCCAWLWLIVVGHGSFTNNFKLELMIGTGGRVLLFQIESQPAEATNRTSGETKTIPSDAR